jgi:Fur family ferric uptake transcriptional regulator
VSEGSDRLRRPQAEAELDFEDLVSPRLRRLGQRLTPRRRRLLEVLAEAGHPLTITEITDSDQSLATSSAYRNLLLLEQAGLVHRVITEEDFARYELAEELTEHHHHLVCSSCGLVRDLPSDRNMERLMGAVIAKAVEQGFVPVNHRLDIVGLCSDCSRTAKSSGSARG